MSKKEYALKLPGGTKCKGTREDWYNIYHFTQDEEWLAGSGELRDDYFNWKEENKKKYKTNEQALAAYNKQINSFLRTKINKWF